MTPAPTAPARFRRTDVGGWIARRAVRAFQPAPVPPELICRVLDDARWTGSARNNQPWRLVVVTQTDLLAKLASLGHYAGHLADAPLVIVLLSPTQQRRDTSFDLGRLAQSVTLLAAEAQLGACIVSLYPETNAATAAALLGATPGWTARHAIAVGTPAPKPRGRPTLTAGRHALDELLTFTSNTNDRDSSAGSTASLGKASGRRSK